MACPRGYRGRHTGLYRDTEGKQPRARNLRTKFQARRPSRRAAPDGSRTIPPGGWKQVRGAPHGPAAGTAVKGPGTDGQ